VLKEQWEEEYCDLSARIGNFRLKKDLVHIMHGYCVNNSLLANSRPILCTIKIAMQRPASALIWR